jgi:phage I-like protein
MNPTPNTISNGVLENSELPGRIKIMAWGPNPSTKGVFSVGSQTLENLEANQRAAGFERVAVDFDHCSVPSTPQYETMLRLAQPPIILAYGRPHVIADDGIWLEEVQWTPTGKNRAKEYSDISPAIVPDRRGEVQFIHSVALTPNGALAGVTLFSAAPSPNTEKTMQTEQLRGIARITAANERANTVRMQMEQAARTARPPVLMVAAPAPGEDSERACLVQLLTADGRAPFNPHTGRAYTGDELRSLDVSTLRLLHANAPGPLKGISRMVLALEREQAAYRQRMGYPR